MQQKIVLKGLAIVVVAVLVACGSGAEHQAADPILREELAPVAVACPVQVPRDARCLGGKDFNGAYYLIAIPANWQGDLVMHAHGGPALGAPTMARVEDDLGRWSIMVRAGYAWAGSSYRQGGVAVRAAAEDTERLRRIFHAFVEKPTHTFLHGQSWGASVAAKTAEMFASNSAQNQPYDALLLTNGVLAGGTHSYDVRLDLRVVYQYLCGNHPRPTEQQYPLNIGYPAGATINNANIAARTQECLGLEMPRAQRTAQQQANIDTIVRVVRIPEDAIQSHLNWGTRHFQEIVSKRTAGVSPFGNTGVRYSGSSDDAALNAGVERFVADPKAYAMLAHDTDLTGAIAVPILSVKWINDPTAFVELDHFFKKTMDAAGAGDRLVQTFTRTGTHSYLNDASYVGLMQALSDWVHGGQKPTPQGVAERCEQASSQYGAQCTFEPLYQPKPLATRVPERQRPQ
ncbi:hypothetical protein E9531_02450 [Lampropedia puyangensis]|uniref:Alpha/beta hydrolase n=1 Tax=Lampropedia puyangensis TaxID=1330072 RepID=A0A4S8FCV4_9BURK|nr:hypothetical protein [Lampropedia puyangensis]THU05418.1 hypothetical protein E9531_02450 [Lampropedia puyangensis]